MHCPFQAYFMLTIQSRETGSPLVERLDKKKIKCYQNHPRKSLAWFSAFSLEVFVRSSRASIPFRGAGCSLLAGDERKELACFYRLCAGLSHVIAIVVHHPKRSRQKKYS